MIIRAKSFEAWMKANFDKGTLRDLAEYGASGGFPGLTWYKDTVKLYDRFSDEIWEALDEDASSMGHNNALELVASFNGAKNVSGDDTFKNLLVWYMAERIARELTNY